MGSFRAQLDKVQQLCGVHPICCNGLRCCNFLSTRWRRKCQTEESPAQAEPMWDLSGDLPSNPLDLTEHHPWNSSSWCFGQDESHTNSFVTSLLSHSPAGSATFSAGHSGAFSPEGLWYFLGHIKSILVIVWDLIPFAHCAVVLQEPVLPCFCAEKKRKTVLCNLLSIFRTFLQHMSHKEEWRNSWRILKQEKLAKKNIHTDISLHPTLDW